MATVLIKQRTANGKSRPRSNGKSRGVTPPIFADDAMLGDVLERLGGIPASRVRLFPAPGTATIRDLRRLDRRTNGTCELIDGVIVEKAMGWYESFLATVLSSLLTQFVRQRRLGIVLGADGTLRILPKQVRAADVSFVSRKRLAKAKPAKEEPYPAVVPDLAVEVLSKSNTRREMERKLNDYFSAGVLLVWMIDPRRRQATVHTSTTSHEVIGLQQTLDGRDVLPGFRVVLQDLFDEVDQILEEMNEE